MLPLSYGSNVARDLADITEARLRELVPQVEEDERFRVYGVPGDGYAELHALTADEGLQESLRAGLDQVEQELKGSGASVATFVRLESRFPSDATARIVKWVHNHVERNETLASELQDLNSTQTLLFVASSLPQLFGDGNWISDVKALIGSKGETGEDVLEGTLETTLTGTISRDGEIKGSLGDWLLTDEVPQEIRDQIEIYRD